MNTTTKQLFGVNIVSLVPNGALGPWGLERCINLAREAGLDGLQTLPMRGWQLDKLSVQQKNIIAWEDAWNTPNLSALLTGKGTNGKPTILDFLLFQREIHPYIAESIQCAQEPMGKTIGKSVFEVNHKSGVSFKSLRHWTDGGGDICIDTLHFRKYLAQEVDMEILHSNTIEDYAAMLRTSCVKLVHIHFKDKEEQTRFLRGKNTQVRDILWILKRFGNPPIIFEFFPTIESFIAPVEFLRTLKARTEYCLH